MPITSGMKWFPHAHAEWRINVLAIERNALETRARVQRNRFRLSFAGFEHDLSSAQRTRVPLESLKDATCDPSPAKFRNDVHALDLCRLRIDEARGTAAGWVSIDVGDEKHTAP